MSASPGRLPNGNFAPGNRFGKKGGRPKGIETLKRECFRDLVDAWEKGGADALARMQKNDPGGFVRAAFSLLPRELNVTTTSRLEDMDLDGKLALAEKLTKELEILTGEDVLDGEFTEIRTPECTPAPKRLNGNGESR